MNVRSEEYFVKNGPDCLKTSRRSSLQTTSPIFLANFERAVAASSTFFDGRSAGMFCPSNQTCLIVVRSAFAAFRS